MIFSFWIYAPQREYLPGKGILDNKVKQSIRKKKVLYGVLLCGFPLGKSFRSVEAFSRERLDPALRTAWNLRSTEMAEVKGCPEMMIRFAFAPRWEGVFVGTAINSSPKKEIECKRCSQRLCRGRRADTRHWYNFLSGSIPLDRIFPLRRKNQWLGFFCPGCSHGYLRGRKLTCFMKGGTLTQRISD